MRTTNANHAQFYIPSSHVVNETCEIHFNNTFYLTPHIQKYYQVDMWSVRTVTPLRAYLWALLVPSMPREGWGQLGSATSAPLPNHKGRFPLEPKQEKGGNFSASSFALTYLTCPPYPVLTGSKGLNAHAPLHLLPRAPSSSVLGARQLSPPPSELAKDIPLRTFPSVKLHLFFYFSWG